MRPTPVGREDEIAGRRLTRDILNLTVSIDHDMVDAAPAARFASRLRQLMEAGYGLPEGDEAVPATAETASTGTRS